jgi:UDP-3-O-[3-hydroxymyristoyl] N-acetylglucosamine deacetylase
MVLQRTLKKEVELNGIGLHTGVTIQLKIKPAPAGHGIVFVRSDLEGRPSIPARHHYIVNTQLATSIGVGPATISTVEHLLAALYGVGIDNCLIEVSGPEMPIMDGSSVVFYEAILAAGVEMQKKLRPRLALRKRVEVKSGEKWAVAEPSAAFEIHGSIEWDHPAIGYQEFHYIEGKNSFRELMDARTFGFMRDVEALKKMGLARGGSLENAVVLDHALVLNPEGLRHPDEFIRHKVLDALGDFKLAGISLQGFFRLHRAGHDLHSQLLAEILSNPNHYEILNGSREELEVESAPVMLSGLLAVSC